MICSVASPLVSKQIASQILWTLDNSLLTDVNPDGVEAPAADAEANIYNIWRHLLDENEKIAKARLAAVQVFQDQISEDAKNLRSGKNLHAKKSLDRLNAVQKDVQQAVSEVNLHQQLKILNTIFCTRWTGQKWFTTQRSPTRST